MLGYDFAWERFNLAEGDGFEAASAFEAKRKAPYARKQVEYAKFRHLPISIEGALLRLPSVRVLVGDQRRYLLVGYSWLMPVEALRRKPQPTDAEPEPVMLLVAAGAVQIGLEQPPLFVGAVWLP